ncbi:MULTISPECIES: VOC family protein [unclassified Roseitalea]|uniref:VOC family protein n=1 Tax=unclassified Roseitalea TaxID=2639107 RepID=UPI00273E1EF5|nr:MULTISPECIES: VOC family protein [unclassified Roseitalea]
MHPIPYLFFNGQCRQALDFYADVFDGEVSGVMPASQMPPEFPVADDKKDWIMHARLGVGDGAIMASDNIMETSAPMDGCSVMLSYPTAAEARAVFDRLAEGGEITMAFEPTFWAAGFGTLRDRFGVRWMIGSDEPPAAA